MNVIFLLLSILSFFFLSEAAEAHHGSVRQSESGSLLYPGIGGCDGNEYTIYLIDNFDQRLAVLPEVAMTHGKLVQAMLLSGRNDINLHILNTSLRKGLTDVYHHVTNGGCADAVVSSIPGSNYTYGQVSSLLSPGNALYSGNILEYRHELLELMLEIATSGFPSLTWLKEAEVNPIKLREDAKKILYIELLGEMGVPVFLPYGNPDSPYRGEPRTINLLSLSNHAQVFSGSDADGNHLPNYPQSPLSTGDALAKYSIAECPDYDNVRLAHVDINNDGHIDFSFDRAGGIPYYDERGEVSHTPSFLNNERFFLLLEQLRSGQRTEIVEEIVLTREQFTQLLAVCPTCKKLQSPHNDDKEVVWLNSKKYGRSYWFSPQCQKRETISGTSLIPPVKVREALPVRN